MTSEMHNEEHADGIVENREQKPPVWAVFWFQSFCFLGGVITISLEPVKAPERRLSVRG